MPLRILSVVAPLLSLFFFPAFVAAQISVTANCTDSSLFWTFNSHGQSPCTVAGNMLALCYAGKYSLVPLPPGTAYQGPQSGSSNYCECSTVGYSLISACVTCQDRTPLSLSQYGINCSNGIIPSQFPNPVPADTFVPHWALLNITENLWNVTESNTAGDTPEYGPGTVFNSSGVITPPPAATSHSKSNAGPIAGGVAGGLFLVAVAIILTPWIKQRYKQPGAGNMTVAGARSLMISRDGTTVVGTEAGKSTNPVANWAREVAAANVAAWSKSKTPPGQPPVTEAKQNDNDIENPTPPPENHGSLHSRPSPSPSPDISESAVP